MPDIVLTGDSTYNAQKLMYRYLTLRLRAKHNGVDNISEASSVETEKLFYESSKYNRPSLI